jgi:hypothetical protein
MSLLYAKWMTHVVFAASQSQWNIGVTESLASLHGYCSDINASPQMLIETVLSNVVLLRELFEEWTSKRLANLKKMLKFSRK